MLIFLSLSCNMVLWYAPSFKKSSGTFCCFPIPHSVKGNQHGIREYDDLQNWLDMTSHENPLLVVTTLTTLHLVICHFFIIISIGMGGQRKSCSVSV